MLKSNAIWFIGYRNTGISVPTDDGLKMGSIFTERIITIHKNNQKEFSLLKGKTSLYRNGQKAVCLLSFHDVTSELLHRSCDPFQCF